SGELKALITPMFRLVDDNPIKFRPSVPERYFTDIQIGQTVDVEVESYPGRKFTGTVTRKNEQVDPANRTFPIEVVVRNDEHLLPPGAFARGRVRTHTDPAVLFVPLQAVVSFAGESKVFTVKDGKAREVRLAVGEESRENPDGSRRVEVAKVMQGNLSGEQD